MPVLYVPASEREVRVKLSADTCVIDGREYFIRGCLEIPVQEQSTPFIWGVWAEVSESAWREYQASCGESPKRPFIGRLPSVPPIYEDSEPNVEIQTRSGIRPSFRVIPDDHPIAQHQREGFTVKDVRTIAEKIAHHGAVSEV
jgi:hypothetical protein